MTQPATVRHDPRRIFLAITACLSLLATMAIIGGVLAVILTMLGAGVLLALLRATGKRHSSPRIRERAVVMAGAAVILALGVAGAVLGYLS